MKFIFSPSLTHQNKAVKAVVYALDGHPYPCDTELIWNIEDRKKLFSISVGRNPLLYHDILLTGIQNSQKKNNLPVSQSLSMTQDSKGQKVPNLSIDMETGTGKTYTYLKTILELHKKYCYSKFIIVVPSIAIREGILKSFEITKPHFRNLQYEEFNYFSYDAKNLNPVKQDFAKTGGMVQIMIMNIQAFVKDLPYDHDDKKQKNNIIYRTSDKFSIISPVDILQKTRPVLVLDEPQSIDTTARAKSAIANLDPSLILRYSATHENKHNIVYRLSPVDAYKKGLVKEIEIASVKPDNWHNTPWIRVLGFRKNSQKQPQVCLEFEKQTQDDFAHQKKWLGKGSDLFTLSGERSFYKGYTISNISRKPGHERVEFKNEKKLLKGEESGTIKDEQQEKQIHECVAQHFEKVLRVKDNRKKPVKILSLFFIDKVAHYRGEKGVGKFVKSFEKSFNILKQQKKYKELIPYKAHEVHGGYFSQDRKGYKDSEGNSKVQKKVYELIMRDKEKLLNIKEPLQFIFSHSALKEGWDNPNVFQICTLNDTTSERKKKQEIGRGMRLPVDCDGSRINDNDFNKLTIVTNEAYEELAKNLQKEFRDETGESIKPPGNAKKRDTVKPNKKLLARDDFRNFWEKINATTRYRLTLNEEKIIKAAANQIRNREIENPAWIVSKVLLERKDAMQGELAATTQKASSIKTIYMPDILFELQENTSLPRKILFKILKRAQCFDAIKKNPDRFIKIASLEIQEVLKESLANGIRYIYHKNKEEKNEKIQAKKNRLTKNIKASFGEKFLPKEKSLVYDVTNIGIDKTVYKHIACDSDTEKKAAKEFNEEQETKIFIKLPREFVVNTPFGNYNPDWAIIKDEGKEVDFVKGAKPYLSYRIVETKSSERRTKLRGEEAHKSKCAEEHFKAIGIKYDVEKPKY